MSALRSTIAAGPGKPRRRGFVLAAALLSMLLIAALLAAVFFATTEETRTAVATANSENALIAAESAVEAALGSLVGSAATPEIGLTTALSDGSGHSSVYVTRLDSTVFWIVGEAFGDQATTGAARRVGVFATITTDSAGSIRVSPIPERGWSELF